jgi:hybrid cluster-associated redox disulfide protein
MITKNKVKRKIKKKKSSKVNKNMTFSELMKNNPEAGLKLAERGMFCGGCPFAMMETIEQGANAHGVDTEELIIELNKTKKKRKLR